MNELALFAGAGGGILGGKLLGWKTVCAVERDAYCAAVLAQRQNDKILEPFPIWSNVETFDGTFWHGIIDVISAGFPCQPFSIAGKRKQEKDERNMWPQTIRIISQVRPRFVLLENVPGIRKYLPVVIRDLRRNGYTVERPKIISAKEIGAKHERCRVWIMAYLNNERLSELITSGEKQQGGIGFDRFFVRGEWGTSNPAETYIRRGVYGMANRVDRIRALGNGQIPGVVRKAWHVLCPRSRHGESGRQNLTAPNSPILQPEEPAAT